jgi:hypothetical protein
MRVQRDHLVPLVLLETRVLLVLQDLWDPLVPLDKLDQEESLVYQVFLVLMVCLATMVILESQAQKATKVPVGIQVLLAFLVPEV